MFNLKIRITRATSSAQPVAATAEQSQAANLLKIKIAAVALDTAAPNPFIPRAEQIKFINQCDKAAILTARVDRLTRKHSAFTSIAELVTAPRYRPTLYTNAAKRVQDRQELKLIADYYDGYMQTVGDSRRAYRV